MSENLGLSIGKDKSQLVREPLPVMQVLSAVFFLFFPMVCEFHRAPVRNMTSFSFPEYSIEHSSGTEQANMPALQGSKRPTSIATIRRHRTESHKR